MSTSFFPKRTLEVPDPYLRVVLHQEYLAIILCMIQYARTLMMRMEKTRTRAVA